MDGIDALACVVLSILAVSDLRRRRLPNAVVVAYAALYFIHAWLDGESRVVLEAHVATAIGALVFAALLFRFGWLGGGDAKLFAAVYLWTGLAHATTVFFVISLSGLILALVQLACGRMHGDAGAPAALAWLAPARGVPYGVALAAGGIAAVWLPLAQAHAMPLHQAAWVPSIHVRLT
ncbi:A24 family peptidase [Trinickia acidisoli]|uniref:A24 family peptidase n=1 Tax=Trinickia acidisoli TaxID=2767482 RepID=UPI001A8C5A41|nr:prepilin peptidase [Trinickia acidisoli]